MNQDIVNANYELTWNLGNKHPNHKFIAIVQHWKKKEIIFETILLPTDDGYYIDCPPTELSYNFNVIMWREITTK